MQSITQAPRGRRTRVLPEHVHTVRRLDRRSAVVFLSAKFEFDLPNLYPNG